MKLSIVKAKKFIGNALLSVMTVSFILSLCGCGRDSANDNAADNTDADANENKGYSVIDENGEYISQDKEVVGCYRRIGVADSNMTFEEFKDTLDEGKRGYLIANEDHTAFFELDGEKTFYTFDKAKFYPSDDTDKENGFPYTYIGGRLIIDFGDNVTQYIKLSDEELDSYLNESK